MRVPTASRAIVVMAQGHAPGGGFTPGSPEIRSGIPSCAIFTGVIPAVEARDRAVAADGRKRPAVDGRRAFLAAGPRPARPFPQRGQASAPEATTAYAQVLADTPRGPERR